MASFINPLIPRYAELTWDGLIPELVVFEDTSIFISFTYDSTRANIQPLQISIDLFCCSSSSDFICYDDVNNDGIFRLFFQVFRKIKSKWQLGAANVVEYNRSLNTFQCPIRMQNNGCLGQYDSSVDDVSFYLALETLGRTSVQTEGSITSTSLHELIVNDVNPCKIEQGPLETGANLIISLLS